MKKILLSFQQVGGLNALLPLIEDLKTGYKVEITGSLPIRKAFPDCGMSIKKFSDLGWDVHHGDTDVSWMEDLDPHLVITDTINLARASNAIACRHLWAMAKRLGIPCIAYMDSWWGYRERFCFPHERIPPVLPDLIAAVDDLAMDALVDAGLPGHGIRVLGSPRFESLARDVARLDRQDSRLRKGMGWGEDRLIVTFVSQPLRRVLGSEDVWGFTEHSTLEAVLNVLGSMEGSEQKRIVLSVILHPEEDGDDLRALVKRQSLLPDVVFSRADEGFDYIVAADVVLGMFSILLTEAVILERPVLSVQLNLKKEDMLVTNMVGATNAVRSEEELKRVLPEILTSRQARHNLLIQQKKFSFVTDSLSRWRLEIDRHSS